MKAIKVLVLIISISVVVACKQSEPQLVSNIKPDSFFVLVPENCIESNTILLNQNNFEQGNNYFYFEFMGAGDAYSDIKGFIELFENETTTRQQVLNMRSTLVSNCYPNGFYGIPRDGNEWSELEKEVNFLEKNGVYIYAVKIKSDMIQIHIDFNEYRKVDEKG